MNIKQAFELYFEKLNEYYKETFGTAPSVTFTEALNKNMLVSKPDEDGEVEWQPLLCVHTQNWDAVEAALGFAVCDELKNYYSTYYFLSLSGKLNGNHLNFYLIDGAKDTEAVIMQHYNDAQTIFPGAQCFLIGHAVVNDDDSYFIYYDNRTGEVFCFESDTNQRVMLSHSLAEIISSMEALA